jgi:hypothetical protein
MRKLDDLRSRVWKRSEIAKAREFDAKEDRLAEAIRGGALGLIVKPSFEERLTDADMEMLRGMNISWREL